MIRRDIAKALVASTVGSLIAAREAAAQSSCTPSCFPRTAAEDTAQVEIQPDNLTYLPGDVRRYGALMNGSNDTDAIRAAIKVAKSGGGVVMIPAGETVVTGLVIDSDGVRIMGDSRARTILKAGADSIRIINIQASYCQVENLRIEGNGHSAVRGIDLSDINETQTSLITQKNFNTFRDLWIHGCNEGIVLKPGPHSSVTGADSGCFYNRFDNIHIENTTRGIWLREGTNSGSSGPNRNFFTGVRIGQPGCNVGVHIESGDSNQFFQCSFEGILTGSFPLPVPTAIKIHHSDAHGIVNNYNAFVGVFNEACTRDVENANQTTNFVSCFFDQTKCIWSAFPNTFVGGYLATIGPAQAIHGVYYGSNSEVPGYPNDVAYFPGNAAVPNAGSWRFGSTGVMYTTGNGSPEGVVVAAVGSLYSRKDGGAGTSLYVKQAGSGSTGWSPVSP